jgi:tRNA-5-taurinomethyluridine 2-sulfurtransferase
MKKKIAVLVSGGVDSSVALALLKEQGYDVTAFYLKIWLEDELSFLGECPWEEDLKYVRILCNQLKVPLEIVSLQKEYHNKVVGYTVNEIKKGRTPNPDMLCNQKIKFGVALDLLKDAFEVVATGHYASIQEKGGKVVLMRAPDPIKDQTYFLAYLSSQQLKRVRFPLGIYTKSQVRTLALRYNLPTALRKDSQGICFLGKLRFSEFIYQYVGELSGPLLEAETGLQVGTHKGFYYFTIGQRQGIGLSGGPWYVVSKDPVSNTVYVSRSYYALDKQRDSFVVTACNWIAGEVPKKSQLEVKLRHGIAQHKAEVTYSDEDKAHVQLVKRDQGIAAGQFAVFYDGSECLGAGVITETNKKLH